MIESGLSRPLRSRSSTRYLAARSLTDPVGFVISSLANSRTSGRGDIRAISTSGVWPTASRIESYRPPPTPPAPAAGTSAARHGRQDDERIVLADPRLERLEGTD